MRHKTLQLKSEAIGDSVNYTVLRDSKTFQEYKELTYLLADMDLQSLSHDEQKAFWINLYNTLVIHAIIEGMLPIEKSTSTFARLELYATASYKVGHFIFSLNDIENGILRANQ